MSGVLLDQTWLAMQGRSLEDIPGRSSGRSKQGSMSIFDSVEMAP